MLRFRCYGIWAGFIEGTDRSKLVRLFFALNSYFSKYCSLWDFLGIGYSIQYLFTLVPGINIRKMLVTSKMSNLPKIDTNFKSPTSRFHQHYFYLRVFNVPYGIFRLWISGDELEFKSGYSCPLDRNHSVRLEKFLLVRTRQILFRSPNVIQKLIFKCFKLFLSWLWNLLSKSKIQTGSTIKTYMINDIQLQILIRANSHDRQCTIRISLIFTILTNQQKIHRTRKMY